MMHSYNRSPYIKDHNRKHKRFANKRVRRHLNIPSGSSYKRIYQSWNICDYKWLWTKRDAIKEYTLRCTNDYFKRQYPTLELYLDYWARCVRRK
jgi:hypothetical protein